MCDVWYTAFDVCCAMNNHWCTGGGVKISRNSYLEQPVNAVAREIAAPTFSTLLICPKLIKFTL